MTFPKIYNNLDNPLVQTWQNDVANIWNPSRFSIFRKPLHVGSITSKEMFKENLPSCLDMLIKCPQSDIVVPAPYNTHNGCIDFLSMCIDAEDILFSNWRNSHYAYLTVHNTPVKYGETQRNPGWHFDGMQGSRYKTKLKACHSFLCSSELPTEFAIQKFDASQLDENKHNWFKALGNQVKPKNIKSMKELEVVLCSAYQVHRSAVAPISIVSRMFMRLDITEKKFDREENTKNPELKAPFPFYKRPIPKHLI